MWRRLLLLALGITQLIIHFNVTAIYNAKANDSHLYDGPTIASALGIESRRKTVTSRNDVVIFYNMFIPTKKGVGGINLATGIIAEQLNQLGQSDLCSASKNSASPAKPVQLFYNAMGTPPNATWLHGLCRKNNLACKEMKQYANGNEMMTLQDLHTHCQLPGMADSRVVYMHSKGSFHNTSANVYWRRHLGMAVSNQACTHPLNGSTCNVCGLQFYPMWTPFFPGNFFTAQCRYVAKLIPPKSFEAELDQAWKALRQTHETRLYPPASYTAGSGRQAAEHWIGSHPSLQPCDMANTVSIPEWIRHRHTIEDFELKMAPRGDIQAPWFQLKKGALKRLLQNETLRDTEHFMLSGLLKKYRLLYNVTPGEESWVWKWFPDGAKWKEKAKENGHLF